jgi:hypothetical protein
MKRIFLAVVALLLSANIAFATPTNLVASGGRNSEEFDKKTKKQEWTAGWDNFGEPLNYKKSYVSWTVHPENSKLSVTFKLVGATPNKLYQVGVHIFCTTFPATFGQFPTNGGPGGTCHLGTRQGVTENHVSVELGVVTTDINGNGSFAVIVGPIASGTYDVEFDTRDAAGCNLIGGAVDIFSCNVDFQSPGPFGTTTTITIH